MSDEKRYCVTETRTWIVTASSEEEAYEKSVGYLFGRTEDSYNLDIEESPIS